jgi:outer membrane cobalamin receptor
MKKNFLFGLCALMLSQSTLIHAQNVEEVIVTATKTERTLQEVPVAVSVVTADTIEKANVVDFA